jgi:predicted ATPase
MVERGRIRDDEGQRRAMEVLDRLYLELLSYTPPVAAPPPPEPFSFRTFIKTKILGSPSPSSVPPLATSSLSESLLSPQGVYLYGDVGLCLLSDLLLSPLSIL